MRTLLLAVVVWLTAAAALAQPIQPGQKASLSAANATAIISTVNNTTLTVQVLGTWTGTLSFESSLDGSTFTATNCTAVNGTTAVTTTTSNGVWSCSVIGLNALQTRFSSFGSGTAVVSYQTAYVAGGAGGGGGSGSAVSITQGGNTAAVNGSSQLSVNCANCSGSGVSQQDNTGFVPGTTNFVPLGGEVDDVGTSAVTENSAGAARITAQRGLHTNLRNNSGTEIGVAAAPLQVSLANTAANATAVKVDGSAVTQPISGTVTVTDGAGALNVIVDSGTTAVTQGTAASLNATVVGTGTFATQAAQSGTWNITNVSGTVSLPTLASTSTKQSDGSQKTQIVDGSGNVIASTSNNLNVQCANCSGSGVSAADEATFTAGTSLFALGGGFFQTTSTSNALTNGQQGAFQLTAQRALFSNLRNASGTEVGTSTTPLQVSLANTGSNATAVHTICDSGCAGSGGTSLADEAAFTQGTTAITPVGGIFKNTYTSLTTGQAGVLNLTAKGAAKVILCDASDNCQAPTVDATTNTTTQTTGPQVFYNGSTAAPSDVGADGRSVAAWSTLKGAAVTAPSFAGVIAVAGNGVSGTGVQRVTIASDSTGTVIATSATAANLLTRTDTSAATGAAPPARADYQGGIGSGATGGFLTGFTACDFGVKINISTGTTTLMVTGVSGRIVHICNFHMLTAAANNVAWIEGTGATCGTGTTGMAGGTTAASGYNFAANGGMTLGAGLGDVLNTSTTGDSVCLVTSAATQLSGFIRYAIY